MADSGQDEEMELLASQARLFEGCHENEVFFWSEADLHKHKTRCGKNPKHEKFIPVEKFVIKDLPVPYQDDDVFQLIKLNAFLTVKVLCSCTSQERPEFYTGTANPFPFYRFRGTPLTRTGTGRAWSTRMFQESENRCCPCSRCVGLSRKVWGKVSVYTARHVVFDVSEARKTVCAWGYDSEEHRGKGLTVDMEGVEIGVADHEGDTVEVICMTHDLNLVQAIEKARIDFMRVNARVYNRYKKDDTDVHRLVVIVSHPHGCSKQVTVGEWTMRAEVRDQETAYYYNTDTCPGSSGATVYIMGRKGVGFCHVHSGSSALGNQSGYWVN